MKLVTATLATAALLAFAGASIAPAAHAQSDQQQQQDKTKPKQEKQQKTQHPQQQKEQHPAQQQKQQREAQPREQQHQQQAQKQQKTQQKQQQKTAQHQQKQQQKQQQRAASHQPANNGRQPNNGRYRAQTQPARGGHARGNPQQTAHYEQAHMRRYQPRSGERVVRIPDNDFNQHFGRGHRFHMGVPVAVGGFPRFQYSGFSFVLEEPWPTYWYDSDDFYVIFDNGMYWLCDYNDPGVQVELVVVTG